MGEIKQSLEIGRYDYWVRVNAIIDTGAETSYLREDLAKKINVPKYSRVKTILADGSKVMGYFSQINIKIRNRFASTNVIVIPKLEGDLLIGQDWLQDNDIILDMRKEKFIYGKGMPKIRKVFRLR